MKSIEVHRQATNVLAEREMVQAALYRWNESTRQRLVRAQQDEDEAFAAAYAYAEERRKSQKENT